MNIGQYPNYEAEQREFREPSLATELARERQSEMAPPARLEPREKPDQTDKER